MDPKFYAPKARTVTIGGSIGSISKCLLVHLKCHFVASYSSIYSVSGLQDSSPELACAASNPFFLSLLTLAEVQNLRIILRCKEVSLMKIKSSGWYPAGVTGCRVQEYP